MAIQTRLLAIEGQLCTLSALTDSSAAHATLIVWKRREWASIRRCDTIAATNRVAALGTQRFLVLLPETGEEGAFRAAEKIRRMVGSTIYHIEDGPVTVTASIGVASTVPNQQSAPNLLEHASQALIHSRQSGPNRIQVSLGTL